MLRDALLGLLMVLGVAPTHAAEPTGTLTLACEGERTQTWRVGGFGEEKTTREPISMSIIIDFRAQTGEYFETRTDGWEDRRSLQNSGATEMNISFKADRGRGQKRPEREVRPRREDRPRDRCASSIKVGWWCDHEVLAEMQANAADVLKQGDHAPAQPGAVYGCQARSRGQACPRGAVRMRA